MLLNPFRFQSGPAGPWTPLNMAVSPPVYLDADDSVITASGGSVSAISNLGSLGANGDFSQSDSAKKPAIMSGVFGSRRGIVFDGVDDALTCSTAQGLAIHRSVSAAWAFIVYKKKTNDASPTARTIFSSISGGSVYRFGVTVGQSEAGLANRPRISTKRLDADQVTSLTCPVSSSGVARILLASVDYSVGYGEIRENGSLTASSATLVTKGLTSNTSASSPLALGAFVSSGAVFFPADVDIACLVIGSSRPSAGEPEKLEGWAAHKWGLTANLPSGHPYKTTAPTI